MANGARTVEDLERKYDFASLLGLKKNVKVAENSLIKVNNELNNFLNITLKDLEEQIDGKVATWYYSGQPTLNNSPANEWTTDEVKQEHLGDLYYDKQTGYAYIFEKIGQVYSWSRVKDEDITEALSSANAAQDTADSKRQVFVVQPKPPYSCGDIWINSNEIFICQLERLTGNFNPGDWINNLKYTDNTYAKAIVDELGGTTTTVLSGTVTQYSNSWVKFTDLATGGSTTINGANIKSGTITLDNSLSIANDNILMDKTGITLKNGASLITDKGLMTNLQFKSEVDFKFGLTCDYQTDEYLNSQLVIYVYIPTGFTISNAYLTIVHQPIFWNQTTWGYARNIGIFKSNMNSKFEADYDSDVAKVTQDTSTQVTKAFNGSNTWQPKTPTATSYNIEVKTTSDIHSYVSAGFNKFIIQAYNNPFPTFPSILTPETIAEVNANMMPRSASVMAVLDIYGYMKV